MKKFHQLYTHFLARTNHLVSKYDAPIPPDSDSSYMCPVIHNDGKAFMIVRLQLLWGQFCKELIENSALGRCQTLNGTVLRGVVSGPRDIRRVVNRETGGKPPPWHRPMFAVTMAHNLNTQNYSQLQLALSHVSPADDLKTIRDYIVHPWKLTRMAYDNLSVILQAPGIDPTSLLSMRGVGGNSTFRNWVTELQNIALDAIK